jgi:archaellum component FlaF (FlaF/FlaG flagellin family)
MQQYVIFNVLKEYCIPKEEYPLILIGLFIEFCILYKGLKQYCIPKEE